MHPFLIGKLLTFLEKIYKKDTLADSFEKYISFEKLKRNNNSKLSSRVENSLPKGSKCGVYPV